MSIFNKVADAHAAKVAAAQIAEDERKKKIAEEEVAAESRFQDAVKSGVLPFFEKLERDIAVRQFPAETKFERDGNGLLYVELRFVPQNLYKNPSPFGVEGRDACVFRIKSAKDGRITYTSYFNQHVDNSEVSGMLSLAELNESGLSRYLEDFFQKSFDAAAKRVSKR